MRGEVPANRPLRICPPGPQQSRFPCRAARPPRICLIAAWAFIALGWQVPLAAHGEPLAVTIVHVNDWDRMGDDGGHGGAARIAAVVRAERARVEAAGGLAVATFGGDMISPSVLSGIDRGAHMIDLANAVGFDVAVPGNHEFDFGPEVLRERLAESNAVWLAGNIEYQGRRGFPETRATTMIEKAGYRLGFLGLITPDTAEISTAGDTVAFLPQAEVAATLATELRAAGADLVIALTHNRTSQDMALLRRVRDIDIVLGGHDHDLTAWYDGRQAILKSRSQGRYVGILRLALDRAGGALEGASESMDSESAVPVDVVSGDAASGGGDTSGVDSGNDNPPGTVRGPEGGTRVTWTPDFDLRSTAGVEPDADVAAMVAGYEALLDEELGQVIGRTETELDTRGPVVRGGEAAFGNLVTDALLAATGADIAITNGGGIRGGRVYPPGAELTPRMLIAELPFGKATVVLGLTGTRLREALENGVSRAEENDGRFPQVAGLSFVFDARRPPGSRITRAEASGEPLAPDRVYRVATNDFMFTGGDGYTAFESAEVIVDAASGDTMANHLIDYVRAAGTVAPVIEGRIVRED